MLKESRQQQILGLLRSTGAVEVSEVSRMFGVAEVTVRRDLEDLAAREQVIRTHGGAVLSEKAASSETPLAIRLSERQREKEAIARHALGMIQDGQKIYLDSGSTTFCLARLLDNSRRLVAVTNAINIAAELNRRTGVAVISVGGDLRKRTHSCVGYFAEEMVHQLKLDVAFLGVGGITPSGQLCEVSTLEVAMKRAVIEASKHTVVLADHTKIGAEEFAQTASLKEVDCLITDSGAPAELLAGYRKMGVDVHVVEVQAIPCAGQ